MTKKNMAKKFNVGDSVVVTGYGTADSYGGGAKTKAYENHTMKVIIVKDDDRPRPYALNRNNEDSGVTGWFREEDLSAVATATTAASGGTAAASTVRLLSAEEREARRAELAKAAEEAKEKETEEKVESAAKTVTDAISKLLGKS
ncbi:MAG: hypothetical protein LBR25_04450 [Erysipelotrichaceae bacterium]|nr:hypothetical protein [Erysipelotrichaceae bacterium]